MYELSISCIKSGGQPLIRILIQRANDSYVVMVRVLQLIFLSWYHDELTRPEAESLLIGEIAGAFLVRINSHQRKNLTLSVRCANLCKTT